MKTKTVKYRACKNLQELGRLVVAFPEAENWEFMQIPEIAKTIIESSKCLHLRVPAMKETEMFFKVENVIIQKETACICLNSKMYSLQDLFDTFEIKINSEWLPFGVIQK